MVSSVTNTVTNLIVSFLAIGTVTALVLPGSPAVKVITGLWTAFNGSVAAAQGKVK